MYNERFIYEPMGERPSCHAATIAEAPSGEYIAAFYAGTHEGAEDVGILVAHLRQELDGWVDLQTIVDTPDKSDGNPVLHVDDYGHVWLFYVTQERSKIAGQPDPGQQLGWNSVYMYATKSEDEGRTWWKPTQITETLGYMTRNKPVRLPSGRTILPCYDERDFRSFCLISDDECNTWEQSEWIQAPVGIIQPTLLPRDDGTIAAYMRSGAAEDDTENRVIWRSISEDDGMTWSAAERTALPNPNSACDLVLLDNGNAVIAYNDSKHKRSPLTVALSTDGGETWPTKKNIETDDAEFSYPAIIQGHGGKLHLVYTWKRTHIKHVTFDEEWLTEQEEQ